MGKIGNLYIVATPIGNLKDISLRAIETLKSVNVILCEDTRVTKKLLTIVTPYSDTGSIQKKAWIPDQVRDDRGGRKLISYHQHSSDTKKLEILQMLNNGQNLALVTDAGTPGVSDPGNELVAFLTEANPAIKIIPIPGPSSVTTALSVSGFPAGEFSFLGYFPKKGRSRFLEKVKGLGHPLIFFESPYRIGKLVDWLGENLSAGTQICLCQELTKMHERIIRGSLTEVKTVLEKEEKELGRVKGEIVVVLVPKYE